MRTETVGQGEPELAVVGSIHGDEPCGKNAIEKVIEEFESFNKPVKFLIANEEALKQDTRYLDTDLNRSFPGSSQSSAHEERLAVRILEELEGMRVLDIHSTNSRPVPFSTLSVLNETVTKLISSAGMERACLFEEKAGALNEQVDSAIVEVGRQGTEEASEMAYEILKQFLKAENVIDGEADRTDPEIFRKKETIEGGSWKFEGENFSRVEAGEVFASSGSTELVTTEKFYPVLMSTSGYSDMLGFKAELMGKASELV